MSQFYSAPGIYAGPTLKSRNIFTNNQRNIVQFVPSHMFLDGASADPGESPTYLIRAGNILGKETTSGSYRPSVFGLNTANVAAAATSVTVNAAVATEIARLISVNAGSINITLTGPTTTGIANAINRDVVACSAASGTTLTIAATTHAFVAGSLVQPADGSDAPLTILPDQYGIAVQDWQGIRNSQALNLFLRGADLLSAFIVDLVSDDFGNTTEPAAQLWLKTQLKAQGPYTFDNDR